MQFVTLKKVLNELTHDKLPYGVNMAVRCKEQKRHLYNTNYGPRPNSEIRGEETMLMHELLKNGHEGRWVPKAKVSHYIPKKRMNIKYIKNYYEAVRRINTGWQLKAVMFPNRFGNLKNMLRQTVRTKWRYLYHRIFSKNKDWVRDLRLYSMSWGRLKKRLKMNLNLRNL